MGFNSEERRQMIAYVFENTPPPPHGGQPLVGQGLLIIDASRSHADTPYLVGFLRTSDQSEVETSTYDTHNRQTSILPAGFEPAIPASERRSKAWCSENVWKYEGLNTWEMGK